MSEIIIYDDPYDLHAIFLGNSDKIIRIQLSSATNRQEKIKELKGILN